MLFTDGMVTTMMATASASSSLEVEGEGGVVVVVAAEQWDPQEEGMAPPPDAQRTGLLCQVGDVIPTL